jgi:cell division septum initiation protein DivIVA
VADLAAKYEEAIGKFRELREEQVKLAEAAAALAKAAAAGDTNALRPDRLDQLAARQNELDQRLDQVAKAMDDIVRPQPLYDFEKDLQKQIAEETARIRASTATNAAAMNQIAKATSRPDGKRSVDPADVARLGKEAREQAERLGAREQELAETVTKPLEDLSRLHDLVNDFNAFKALYEAQHQLAEQIAAYEKRGPLGRDDQLALKELASREKEVREALEELPGMLREHAKAAGDKFPKAADSGRKLADAIEKARMSTLAGNATERMLDGDGERSAQLAKRLDEDMAKLFGECQGKGPGEKDDELDQYLKLSLGGGKGQSLAQLQECKKFGFSPGLFPRKGNGRGRGSGSGTSQSTAPEMSVLGNEQLAQRGPKESSSKPGAGSATGAPAAGTAVAGAGEKGDILHGLNPADRQSVSVGGESAIEAYRPVVDEYFKAITRRP